MNVKRRDPMVVTLRQWIGRNVRYHRKTRGLTIQTAAEFAGIHWRHWQKIEAGEVNATLETLAGIAKAFGVHVYVLLLPVICPLPATLPQSCEPLRRPRQNGGASCRHGVEGWPSRESPPGDCGAAGSKAGGERASGGGGCPG